MSSDEVVFTQHRTKWWDEDKVKATENERGKKNKTKPKKIATCSYDNDETHVVSVSHCLLTFFGNNNDQVNVYHDEADDIECRKSP